MNITNDVIDGVPYEETPKVSGAIKPKYIMLHRSPFSFNDLCEEYLADDDGKSSAHLLIDKNGHIMQFAPFTLKTWHAGSSYWQGHHGLNGFAIGIVLTEGRNFLSTAQSDCLDDLLPVLVQQYSIRDIINQPLPYDDPINCDRWKWLVQHGNADSEGRYIATATVDCYAGPSPHFRVMDEIKIGDGVKVLRRQDDWLYILYEHQGNMSMRCGWVHESFFRRL